MNNENALDAYEQKQAEIKKLLKQIEAGLLKHDRNASGQGGSIVMTTPSASKLVATGRTYTIDSQGGTFGQFIRLHDDIGYACPLNLRNDP